MRVRYVFIGVLFVRLWGDMAGGRSHRVGGAGLLGCGGVCLLLGCDAGAVEPGDLADRGRLHGHEHDPLLAPDRGPVVGEVIAGVVGLERQPAADPDLDA